MLKMSATMANKNRLTFTCCLSLNVTAELYVPANKAQLSKVLNDFCAVLRFGMFNEKVPDEFCGGNGFSRLVASGQGVFPLDVCLFFLSLVF
jgi:hypothetical protein